MATHNLFVRITPDFDSFRRSFIVANAPTLYYMDADQRTAELKKAYAAVWGEISDYLLIAGEIPLVYRGEWTFNETSLEDIDVPLSLEVVTDCRLIPTAHEWDGDDTNLLADSLDLR